MKRYLNSVTHAAYPRGRGGRMGPFQGGAPTGVLCQLRESVIFSAHKLP
jgi:hypothetical protein